MSHSKKSSSDIKFRFGHSPDPDDAFMFWGLATGRVPIRKAKFINVLSDIATLNQMAKSGSLEATAISTASYPPVADRYWIMTVGSSVGRRYGPIIVTSSRQKISIPRKNTPIDLQGMRIGIPGKSTTAYLLLQRFCRRFQPIEMSFDKILPAVKSGKVSSGLLIHEGQLTYAREKKISKLVDLGLLWWKETRLPLPLGLDLVRKNLGRKKAREVATALKESILKAKRHKREAIEYARQFGRGISPATTEKFIDMYVNQDTLKLDHDGRKAVRILTDEACRLNGQKNKIVWNDTFISPFESRN